MRFLRSGSIYAIANMASAAVPFLLLPLLTRVLTPAEFGQVVSFMLMVTLCQAFAGLNAHAAIGVIYFQKPREEIAAYTGTALALAVGSTAIVAPLAGLALFAAPRLADGLSPTWGVAAAMTAGSVVMLQCRLGLWQAQHKALSAASLQFASSLLNLCLSLLFVLVFAWGGAGRNGGIFASSLIIAGIAVYFLARTREVRWSPRREQFVELVRFGAPLIAHTLGAVLLSSADRWSVSILLSAEDLGIYGAGAQLGMVMLVLGDAFVKAYGPWLYGKLRGDHPGDHLVAVGAIYVTIPVFLVVAAAAGVFLFFASGILLGDRYRAASSVLPWFMLGGAFNGVYLATSSLYFFRGRTGLLACVTLGSGLAGAVVSWLLATRFGLQGAAMGFAGTQIILGCVSTVVAMRNFDLPWRQPASALSHWFKSLQHASRSPQGSPAEQGGDL